MPTKSKVSKSKRSVPTRPGRRSTAALRVHPSTVVPTGPADRFAIADRVRATDDAPANFAGRVGVIRAVGPGKNEYRVRFGKDKTDVGLLYAQWLKRS